MALFGFDKTKSANGGVRTKALFYETAYGNDDFVIFTLKEFDSHTSDGRPLTSLSQIFIEMTVEDPTEVEFADHVFGSWLVWDKIRSSDKRVVAAVEQWREEATIRRKSIAFKALVSEVKTLGKSSQSTAKYLLEEPWKKPADGRGHREQVRKTTEKAAESIDLKEDIKRLKEAGMIQ